MAGVRLMLAALLLVGAAGASADPARKERIAALGAQIAAAPGDASLYLQRSLIYSAVQLGDLARADVARAEQLGNPADAAYARGILEYREGDFAAARRSFDRYLAAHPSATAAQEYRFRLSRDAGDYVAAMADYRHLVEAGVALAPGHHLAAAHMVQALLPAAGPEAALALLDARMAQLGAISVLQRAAIDLERQRGNYAGALARMAQLEEPLRATPEWQLDVTELLIADGRPGEALPYLELAAEQLDTLRHTTAHDHTRARLAALQAETERRLAADAG